MAAVAILAGDPRTPRHRRDDVTSTVMVLDFYEAYALARLLNFHPTLAEDYPILDELAEELAKVTPAFLSSQEKKATLE